MSKLSAFDPSRKIYTIPDWGQLGTRELRHIICNLLYFVTLSVADWVIQGTRCRCQGVLSGAMGISKHIIHTILHNDNNIMMEMVSEGRELFDAQKYLMDKIYCVT